MVSQRCGNQVVLFIQANPGSSLRFNTHWSASQVSALARSGRPSKMSLSLCFAHRWCISCDQKKQEIPLTRVWADYFSPTPTTKPPGGPGGPTHPPPHSSKRLYFRILGQKVNIQRQNSSAQRQNSNTWQGNFNLQRQNSNMWRQNSKI